MTKIRLFPPVLNDVINIGAEVNSIIIKHATKKNEIKSDKVSSEPDFNLNIEEFNEDNEIIFNSTKVEQVKNHEDKSIPTELNEISID